MLERKVSFSNFIDDVQFYTHPRNTKQTNRKRNMDIKSQHMRVQQEANKQNKIELKIRLLG